MRLRPWLFCLLVLIAFPAAAVAPETVQRLAGDDSDAKIAAVQAKVASDPLETGVREPR